MNAQEYIENRLKNLQAKEETVSYLENTSLADFIYARIMSKKFRKFSVSEEAKNKVRVAIDLNIKNNEPIKFVLPFGSYKIWRFEESPEVDWAELFSMMYYAKWLLPIAEVYKPGVLFDFCADDAILEKMNNTPSSETEKYKETFRALMHFVQSFLPENFKFAFSPVGERYNSKEEFLDDLNKKVEEFKNKTFTPLTEKEIEMIKFNVRPVEGEVLDPEKNRILHDAYMSLEKRRAHHKTPDKISVCNTPFGGTSIPVGSTKTSVVKIQTGIGVLKKIGETYLEYIYSPSQVQSGNFVDEEVSIRGLDSKNFKKIRVLT